MTRKTLAASVAVAAIALGAAFFVAPTLAHGPQGGYMGGYMGGPHGGFYGGAPGAEAPAGYGMMGHVDHMGPGMMGYGWGPGAAGRGMAPGMGPGMMGYGPMGYGANAYGDCPGMQAAQGEDLTVEGVTAFLERRLAWQGNERLKLGEVSAQDDDTIVAEIVTQDGSLVDRLLFDRHSGRATRAE